MAPKLILIIEDDSHIGSLVVQVLREAGYSAELVGDVPSARRFSESGPHPDGIISDLMVAGVADPASLATEIGRIFPGIPLTLMTGVPPNRRAHMGVVHDRVLEKPFELGDLLAAAESMAGHAT